MGFSLPFSKKQKEKEFYFGLYLTNDSAVGFVFEIDNGQSAILAKEVTKFSNGWENILQDVDNLISILEAETKVYLEQAIFFVHSYIIDQESHEIKNPYKDIIKKLVKELELKPLGYIEVHEAVKEYVQQRDQAPPNAVFVELDTNHVGISVYKGGKSVFHEYTSRTSNIAEDIIHVVSKVHLHTLLPSKMIVYGLLMPKDETVHILEKHHWDKEMFVQPPRIEVLKGEDFYQALSDIFIVQIMGEETPVEEAPAFSQEKVEQLADPEVDEVMGFVVGKDIVLDTDIEKPIDDVVTERPHAKKFGVGITLPSLPKNMPTFSIPAFSFPKSAKGNLPIKIGGAVFAFVALLVGIEYMFHKSSIVVYLPAQAVSKEVEMNPSIGEAGDNFAIIPHTLTTDFSDEKDTTGKREIGEKAKGEVMLHNLDNRERSFSKGTKLSTGGLTFTIDQDVRVASSSGINSQGVKQSGKAKVSATAAAIGPQSNIEKGKQLQVADLSDSLFIAIAEATFTGGTKKEIRTVAKKDLEDLKTSLAEKAKAQTNDQVKDNVDKSEILLGELTEVESKDEEYSKEVSEEADTIQLKASIETKYYTVKKAALIKSLADSLKSEVPAGYKLEQQTINQSIKSSKKQETSVSLTIDAQAAAIKDIDATAVVDVIKGKSLPDAKIALADTFQATDIEAKEMNPPIPFFNTHIPFFKKNISLTIATK